MRVNWQHLIFTLIIMGLWSLIIYSFIDFRETQKEKRQKYLRESYSPMSDDWEIQEAYDVIRKK